MRTRPPYAAPRSLVFAIHPPPPPSSTGLRNARAPTSPRSIGFCVIWESISSSSSSSWGVAQSDRKRHTHTRKWPKIGPGASTVANSSHRPQASPGLFPAQDTTARELWTWTTPARVPASPPTSDEELGRRPGAATAATRFSPPGTTRGPSSPLQTAPTSP
jgi:hypothetical protein